MGKPTHIYHPTTGEVLYIPQFYSVEHMKDSKPVTFKDVEYDPKVDPANMKQYLKKDYKVVPEYHKEAVEDAAPPPYEEFDVKTPLKKDEPEDEREDANEDANETQQPRRRLPLHARIIRGIVMFCLFIIVSRALLLPSSHCGKNGKNGNGDNQEAQDPDNARYRMMNDIHNLQNSN